MSTNQPRKPAGTPVGGQWAPVAHAEVDIDLAAKPAPPSSPPTAPRDLRRWGASADLGPIQAKKVNKAFSALHSEGKTYTELTGVVGGETHEWALTDVMGPVRPEVAEAEWDLGERFGWTVTRANHKDVIEAVAQATEKAKASRPVVDKRITPEEDSERRALTEASDRERRERAEREAALMEEVRAKAPAGAEAVVVAELQEDTSDPMTDYFANKTTRRVAIGYRYGQREDFAQLRQVAALFPDTAHLAAKETERRDNYSMGAGNYLSDHGSANFGSGWVVRSYPLHANWGPHLTEVAVPDRPAAPAVASSAGVVVRPSSTGREGFVEVAFAEKPARETLDALKAHGFRWARGSGCWYGRDAAFAQSLAGEQQE